MTDLRKKDLYLLLGVEENATAQQIRKAYRKSALKYHPDKNPDDKKAADLFHELSEALKILTDVGARAAYDHVRAAKKASAQRTAKWDENRKRAKLDLDEREKAAENTEGKAERNLQTEIERLREEGSRILQEETDAMKKRLKTETQPPLSYQQQPAVLKVKWKLNNGGDLYNENVLRDMFSKHGKIDGLVVKVKKGQGTAIVEFANSFQAARAQDTEIGFPQCPLRVSWLNGIPPDMANFTTYAREASTVSAVQTSKIRPANEPSDSSALNEDEFEDLVLARMRSKNKKISENT